MELKLFDGDYAVCSLNKAIDSPICVDTKNFYYITKFQDELSLICLDEGIPKEAKIDNDWKIIKVLEPITLYLVGIISRINKVLEDAKINIFEVSTCDSDYILIKNKDIEHACSVLRYNGYQIV